MGYKFEENYKEGLRMFHTRNILKRIMDLSLLAVIGLVVVLYGASLAVAATAPDLGSLTTYAVVSSTFTNANNPAPPPDITALNGTAGLPVLCYTTGPGGPGT